MAAEIDNHRIAINTLMLYLRNIGTALISLFTSRVILQSLGVDNYGIYNVVGGFVVMFSMISSSLGNAISRFLTYEVGKERSEKLPLIFSTSVNIQLGLSIVIILLGVTIGYWFVEAKMNIPQGSESAAKWVLYCSLLTFAFNLLSVPYNAVIIAHEKMSAFAYISILEASLKLIVAYLIFVSPINKLKFYAILMAGVSLIIRSIYAGYCTKKFPLIKYSLKVDKTIYKEMTTFAGWTVMNNGIMLLNVQGINILINLFFGVAVNAARGIAAQLESVVMRFVNDFMAAMSPQITKSYAAGNLEGMYTLVCRGAKFGYFIFLFLGLPMILEAPVILKLWLAIVPDYTVAFARLTIICTMITMLGHTGYVACMSTGNIKQYCITITCITGLVFPLSYLLYKIGLPVTSTYYVSIAIYFIINLVRLYLMKGMLGFEPILFIKKVFIRILKVTIAAIAIPLIIYLYMPANLLQLIVVGAVCELSVFFSIYLLGLEKEEKKNLLEYLRKKIKLGK